jgi:hypothetical protein
VTCPRRTRSNGRRSAASSRRCATLTTTAPSTSRRLKSALQHIGVVVPAPLASALQRADDAVPMSLASALQHIGVRVAASVLSATQYQPVTTACVPLRHPSFDLRRKGPTAAEIAHSRQMFYESTGVMFPIQQYTEVEPSTLMPHMSSASTAQLIGVAVPAPLASAPPRADGRSQRRHRVDARLVATAALAKCSPRPGV